MIEIKRKLFKKMEKVQIATKKRSKSVLSQMRYKSVPRYIFTKPSKNGGSILGMTKYDVGTGVKSYAAVTGKDK